MKKQRFSLIFCFIFLLCLCATACSSTQSSEAVQSSESTVASSATQEDTETVEDAETQEEAETIVMPTEQEVLDQYALATQANHWFHLQSMTADYEITAEYNGNLYFKVADFETIDAVQTHLETLFSAELVAQMIGEMETMGYVEIEGVLYTLDGARGADISKGEETYAVDFESETEIVLTVTVELLDIENEFAVIGSESYEFPYEYIEGVWVFTDFSLIR